MYMYKSNIHAQYALVFSNKGSKALCRLGSPATDSGRSIESNRERELCLCL
jgi:hypothetical protein